MSLNASAAPSPMRDSPDSQQLTRDFDGELWDSMALEIFEERSAGFETVASGDTLDLILQFPSPVIHSTPIWNACTIQVDCSADTQSVLLAGAIVARGETPSSFAGIQPIAFPVSGVWQFPLQGFFNEPQYAGVWDYWMRIIVGSDPPSVDVSNRYIMARRGRIPTT